MILPKMTPQNLFSTSKKVPPKMAHPVAVYMEVTPGMLPLTINITLSICLECYISLDNKLVFLIKHKLLAGGPM